MFIFDNYKGVQFIPNINFDISPNQKFLNVWYNTVITVIELLKCETSQCENKICQ